MRAAICPQYDAFNDTTVWENWNDRVAPSPFNAMALQRIPIHIYWLDFTWLDYLLEQHVSNHPIHSFIFPKQIRLNQALAWAAASVEQCGDVYSENRWWIMHAKWYETYKSPCVVFKKKWNFGNHVKFLALIWLIGQKPIGEVWAGPNIHGNIGFFDLVPFGAAFLDKDWWWLFVNWVTVTVFHRSG